MRYWPLVKRAFTMIELLVAMVVFSIVLITTISLFMTMYRGKSALDARQTLTRDSYFLLERLQTMIKDYTIDYEEYRNRQYAGCAHTGDNAAWDHDNHCAVFTHYGNINAQYPTIALGNNPSASEHRLFYCSSTPNYDSVPDTNRLGTSDYKVFGWLSTSTRADYTQACIQAAKPSSGLFAQSYGQYEALFTDVKDDVDSIPGAVGDDDDVALGDIALSSVVEQPQELYLISRDGKERLFLRKKQTSNSEWLTWYKLQVLQLRWFDAWVNHDFDPLRKGVYDGIVDTRACDYSLGFHCQGDAVWSGIYSGYRLPNGVDDGREDLTHDDIVITDWSLDIQPLSDPYLSWANTELQINPYIKIFFTAKLAYDNRSWKLKREQIDAYTISLQTMFSLLPTSY